MTDEKNTRVKVEITTLWQTSGPGNTLTDEAYKVEILDLHDTPTDVFSHYDDGDGDDTGSYGISVVSVRLHQNGKTRLLFSLADWNQERTNILLYAKQGVQEELNAHLVRHNNMQKNTVTQIRVLKEELIL